MGFLSRVITMFGLVLLAHAYCLISFYLIPYTLSVPTIQIKE